MVYKKVEKVRVWRDYELPKLMPWVEVPEEEFERVKKINQLFDHARAEDLKENNGYSK